MCSNSRYAQIYSVFSPKGGVGKTTIAINLAQSCAALGLKTLLLELDSSPGDISVLLGLQRDKTIISAIGHKEFNPEWCLHKSVSGLHVLLGPPDPEAGESIESGDVARLIDDFKAKFDVIVVDTATVVNEAIATALKISDRILMVVEPSYGALGRSVQSLSFLENRLGIPKGRTHLVVNKWASWSYVSMRDITDCCELPVAAVVNYDNEYLKRIHRRQNGFMGSKVNRCLRQHVGGLFPELSLSKERGLVRRFLSWA